MVDKELLALIGININVENVVAEIDKQIAERRSKIRYYESNIETATGFISNHKREIKEWEGAIHSNTHGILEASTRISELECAKEKLLKM